MIQSDSGRRESSIVDILSSSTNTSRKQAEAACRREVCVISSMDQISVWEPAWNKLGMFNRRLNAQTKED